MGGPRGLVLGLLLEQVDQQLLADRAQVGVTDGGIGRGVGRDRGVGLLLVGAVAVELYDTPGMEDGMGLLDYLDQLAPLALDLS